jgi:hypothetical protein
VRQNLPGVTNTSKPDRGKGQGLHYSRFWQLSRYNIQINQIVERQENRKKAQNLRRIREVGLNPATASAERVGG